jgi:hypothetical protein
MWCDYDFPDIVESEPLDQAIIDEFADCESLTMKMFDRFALRLLPYEKRKDYYLKHLRFWFSLVNKYDIDCYIGQNFPHEMFDWIIYSIVRKRNGKILCAIQAEFLNRAYFVNDIFDFRFLSASRVDDKSDSAPAAGKRYHEGVIAYYDNKKRKDASFRKPWYMTNPILGWESARLLRKFMGKYDRLAEASIDGRKYVYVPLHLQPELTTSPLARQYVKQELIIELLDYHLPRDVSIVVKEHPNQGNLGRNPINCNKLVICMTVLKGFLRHALKLSLGRETWSEFAKEFPPFVSSVASGKKRYCFRRTT